MVVPYSRILYRLDSVQESTVHKVQASRFHERGYLYLWLSVLPQQDYNVFLRPVLRLATCFSTGAAFNLDGVAEPLQ